MTPGSNDKSGINVSPLNKFARIFLAPQPPKPPRLSGLQVLSQLF
jgi:hypothetical protein